MTLKEVMGCMENADRIRIMETGRKDPLYTGYLGTIQYYLGGTGITEKQMGMEVEKNQGSAGDPAQEMERKKAGATNVAGSDAEVPFCRYANGNLQRNMDREGKCGMKKCIFLGIALVLVLAAAGGAWFFYKVGEEMHTYRCGNQREKESRKKDKKEGGKET